MWPEPRPSFRIVSPFSLQTQCQTKKVEGAILSSRIGGPRDRYPLFGRFTQARVRAHFSRLEFIYLNLSSLAIFSAIGATIDDASLYGGWYSTDRYL